MLFGESPPPYRAPELDAVDSLGPLSFPASLSRIHRTGDTKYTATYWSRFTSTRNSVPPAKEGLFTSLFINAVRTRARRRQTDIHLTPPPPQLVPHVRGLLPVWHGAQNEISHTVSVRSSTKEPGGGFRSSFRGVGPVCRVYGIPSLDHHGDCTKQLLLAPVVTFVHVNPQALRPLSIPPHSAGFFVKEFSL